MPDIFDDVAGTATAQADDIFSDVAGEQKAVPARKPVTLSAIYRDTSEAPTLSERAARLGRGSLSSSLTPPPMDTTKVPLNQFTGGPQGAGMATEEEAQKNGALRAAGPVTLPGPHGVPIRLTPQDEVQMAKSVLPGWDKGMLVHQPEMENDRRLLSVENALMNEEQQKQHPILTGGAEFASGLTEPTNLGLIVATAGAEGLAGPAAVTVRRLIAAGFTAQMLGGAIQQVPEIADAVHRGDFYNAKRLMTHMVLGAGMAGLAARGTIEEPASLTVPRGTISTPLAIDRATTRGEARMQDFEANAAARQGMTGLTEAERGVEAAKRARINAPVEIPRTFNPEEQARVVAGPRQGPKPNPLATEAAQIREQQAAQGQSSPSVVDRRRVSAEQPETLPPPYYELKTAIPRRPPGAIVRPSAAETIAPPKGRLAKVIGAGESLTPETPETLQAQVDALAAGTNRAVYFPKGSQNIPAPPENAQVTVVAGDKPGAGTYYHADDITPQQIRAAVKDGSYAQLLGYTQPKEQAVAAGKPTAVVARDAKGTEIKAGLVDSSNPQAVAEQAAEFARQFPEAKITTEAADDVIAKRAGIIPTPAAKASQSPVSGETPQVQTPATPVQTSAKSKPSLSRFSEDEIEEAHGLMAETSGMLQSQDRPGRYFAEYTEDEAPAPTRADTKGGQRPGGQWYGVTSLRNSMPWFRDVKASPAQLAKALEQGKGALYDRLLKKAADSIHAEREMVRREVLSVSPNIRELSDSIREVDPELTGILDNLAQGRTRIADRDITESVREYVARKVHDADSAKAFSQAVDQLSAEEASTAQPDEVAGRAGAEGPGAANPRAAEARAGTFSEGRTSSAFDETAEVPAYSLTQERTRQPRPTEEQNALPGMENAVKEQRAGAARVHGERLGEEVNRPLGSVDQAAGEMERESPLFRGKGPQGELYESQAKPSFETRALDELVAPNEEGFTGTLYSGLSPAALKKLLPESVREKLDTEVEANQRARGLQGKLYDLESQNAADLIRARNVLKEAPGTPEDMEAIYHHLEDPGIKLDSEQRKILDGYLRPILDESERINEKLEGGQVENYVHRIPVGKGGLLDRILGGESKLSAGRGLSKSSGSLKGRTLMALEDADGNREVVSIKGGTVTAWKDGKATELGKIRGLETQGVKARGDIIEREIAPLQKELDKLEAEHRVLTSSKGRERASEIRIENNENRQAELREGLQDAYRTDEGRLLSEDELRGRVFLDKNGKQWKIGQATTKEIEANTGVRYYKNALASTVLNYLQLRRAERAYDFLESYKRSPDFQEVAAKINGRSVPAGWRPTELPQFHGYAFEPHTAEVLDWYAKRMRAEGPNLYRQIGNFLRTAIFFNPLIHTPNIGVHWIVEKGLTGVGPQNWGRILRTGSRAIDAVIHQNSDFLAALDAGAPLQSARLDNSATTKLLLERMGRELEGNPTAAQKVASALGYANPVKLVRAIYDFSGRVTWVSNDIAMLQATYEHMDRTGGSFKEAMADVSKHIPDYRLPTRIFNSTALAKLMSSPDLTMFGAYHYGALRSYGEMAKGLISEDMPQAERMKSLDRLAMLGLFTFVAYPALDQLAKYLTGDKSAQFRRAGASTFIYNLAQLAKGEKSPTQVLESVATPAVHTKALLQLAVNRDFFTGRRIVDWNADAKTIGKQLARYGGQNLAPVNQGMQVAERRRTLGQQVAGLAGIRTNVPTPAEALARKFAAESAGTAAPDHDTLERSYMRKQYENDLRDRKITLPDIGRALIAGTITQQDAKTILQRAAHTPLQNAFKGLPIEKALQVWQKADDQERQSLRALLIAKVERVNPDRYNPAQLKDLISRVRSALTGSVPTAPPSRPFGIPFLPAPRVSGSIPSRPPVGAVAQ